MKAINKYRHLGFSLIEVLISLFILSFSVLGLTTLQVHILRSSRIVQNQIEALYFAEARLEQIRNIGFSTSTESDSSGVPFYVKNDNLKYIEGQYNGKSHGRYEEFNLISTMTRHTNINELILVEVNVVWKDDMTDTSYSTIRLNSAFLSSD